MLSQASNKDSEKEGKILGGDMLRSSLSDYYSVLPTFVEA